MITWTDELQKVVDAKHNLQSRINNIEQHNNDDEQAISQLQTDILVIRTRITERVRERKRLIKLYKSACDESIRIQQAIVNSLQ